MDTLTVDLGTFDVGARADSAGAVTREIVSLVTTSWDEGADVVVLPEYLWMALEPFVTEGDKIEGVARLFWESVWPGLVRSLARPDRAAVLGTVPCLMPDGTLRNRAPIVCGCKPLHQDKLCLTPWEDRFRGGDRIALFEFRGAKFAVLVCLDIEVPELAAALRGRGVDAILVPSATEGLLGLERISRCASARSVELCCHVGVAHLTGTAASELVDKNVGRAAWFSPSQAAFDGVQREAASPVAWSGAASQLGRLDLRLLRRCRAMRIETNPSRISAGFEQKILVESIRVP